MYGSGFCRNIELLVRLELVLSGRQHLGEARFSGFVRHVLLGLEDFDRRRQSRCLDGRYQLLTQTDTGLEEVGMTNLSRPFGNRVIVVGVQRFQ